MLINPAPRGADGSSFALPNDTCPWSMELWWKQDGSQDPVSREKEG